MDANMSGEVQLDENLVAWIGQCQGDHVQHVTIDVNNREVHLDAHEKILD